jgi:uncharacterized protein
MIPLTESAQGISFAVRVQPRARRNAITGELGDALKVALTAPPLEGRANEELIAFFSELLKVSRSAVAILAGEQNRNKIVRIGGISRAQLEAVLSASRGA